VALDARVELLVAALDLKLVQLLRDAIRTTAAAGGRGGAASGLGPAPNTGVGGVVPRKRVEPEPVIEPRKRIHPTPRFEPRPVIYLTPRVVEPPPAVCPPAEPEKARIGKSFLVPPWKVLPWEQPPSPPISIKVIRRKPDIVRKGTLIDCFI
jgi:hypothetical protein